jgi:hypothetical protein
MKKILEYNYCLAKWFAGNKKDKVISGTVFLFLNQLCFLILALFLFVNSISPFIISAENAALMIMFIFAIIMFGSQKYFEKKVSKNAYEYKKTTQGNIYLKRLIALLLFTAPFFIVVLIVIIIY